MAKQLVVACGALWRYDDSGGVSRLDLEGQVVWSTGDVGGSIFTIEQRGDECWGDVHTSVGVEDVPHSVHLARLDEEGSGLHSPNYADPTSWGGTTLVPMGGAFWLSTYVDRDGDSGSTDVQRLDANTWQPVGAVWRIPGQYFGAGNHVWTWSAGHLQMLDIPIGAHA